MGNAFELMLVQFVFVITKEKVLYQSINLKRVFLNLSICQNSFSSRLDAEFVR